MAEQLVSLVQIYDLSNHAEPVKRRTCSSKWRDSFPVPLDDDTVPVSLMDFYEQLLLNHCLQKNKPLSVSVLWEQKSS